jgi:2-keto-3-deoxy-L-fuconate dehydrogenase
MGIGHAYVEALLSRGYRVAIFDCADSTTCIQQLKSKFPDATVVYYECNVGNSENFQSFYYTALLEFKIMSFNVFVCNAGIMRNMFVDVDKQINVNLLGTIHGVELAIKSSTQALLARARKETIIVCTASTNGLIPADADMAPVHVASKFAIVGFVRSLKVLASRYNVRVNAICPVTVDTPMVHGLITPEVSKYLREENRGGILNPSDCADVLLKIIDDPTIYGEILTVHPNSGPKGRIETLDPSGRLNYLGSWREENSFSTKEFVDAGFEAIQTGALKAFGSANSI